MDRDRHNFLSFRAIFCIFTPITTQIIKILRKQKKHQEISSFYTRVPKIIIICYTVPKIWRVIDVIVISKLKKMKTIKGDIIISHECNKNHDHMIHCS